MSCWPVGSSSWPTERRRRSHAPVDADTRRRAVGVCVRGRDERAGRAWAGHQPDGRAKLEAQHARRRQGADDGPQDQDQGRRNKAAVDAGCDCWTLTYMRRIQGQAPIVTGLSNSVSCNMCNMLKCRR